MDKARKKELLKAYADEQRQSFKDSLPMDEELFWNLFDYVDEKLEANDGCHQGRGSCLIVIDSTDKIAFNAFHHESDWYKDCVAEE